MVVERTTTVQQVDVGLATDEGGIDMPADEVDLHVDLVDRLEASGNDKGSEDQAAEQHRLGVLNNGTILPNGRVHRARVFVVEDHPLFCEGLCRLFEREREFEVVGQAAHGASALNLARQCQPDVLLLDIGLAGSNGLDLVMQLFRLCPKTKIVVITGRSEHDYVRTALRLGVHAFLQKDVPGSVIVNTVRAVLRGERVIAQPQVLTTALVEFGQLLRDRELERFGLTDQEVEMLQLASAGLRNRDIGARQFWSEITVKRKMQDVYRKLEVTSRAQAVAEAIRLGII